MWIDIFKPWKYSAWALAWATAAFANSILTADCPGEPGVPVDARALGMGGAALGLCDGTNLNALNPAVLASLKNASFDFTILRGYNDYETAYGKSVSVSYDIPGAELAVPAGRDFVVGFSFREKLSVNYRMTTPLEYEGAPIGMSERRGVGAMYALRATVARKWQDRWLAGFAAGYDLGGPREVEAKAFKAKGYNDISETHEMDIKGVGGTLGIGYIAGEKLFFGAAAEFYLRHSVHEELYNDFTTYAENVRHADLPWAGGLGAAYNFNPHFRAAADARYTRWSDYKIDGRSYGYRDTMEFHGGVEGRINTEAKGFFLWRMPYRAGAFYVPWYDQSRGDYAFAGVTLGAGYLFHNNQDSRLDVAFEYGRRGGGAQPVREEQMNLYLSVVGLETWFGRQQDE